MADERRTRFSTVVLIFSRHRWAVTSLMLILAAGAACTWWVARLEDREMRQGLLADARLVANAIDLQHVQNLSGSDADLNSPDYQRLKEQLTLVRSAKSLCRFLYLMGRWQDGTVFFFVDSEPPDSNDYSPPGQVYDEADDMEAGVFEMGIPTVHGPRSDRWGTWVSGLVPVTDTQTGAVIAVLGMDIDAHNWNKVIAIRCAVPVLIALLLVALLTTFFVVQRLIDRKQAEESLRESEQRYKTLFEANADGILIADVATKQFRYANPAICRMLGYSEDELVRLSISDIHPKESLERVAAEFEAQISGAKVLADDLPCVRKDGRIISVSISAGVVTIDRTKYLMGVFRDITERKQVTEALKESEEKYRSLVENIPDVIWITDVNGKTIFISSNVEKVYGYTPEDIYKGGDEVWFGKIHPDDKEKIGTAFETLFEKGSFFDIEYRIQRKDGEWIWLHDRAMKVYEKNGVKYADGLFTDITERKKTEDELFNAKERFRIAAETSNDVVYEWDMQQSIQWFGKIDELLGYGPGEFPRTMDGWTESVHPEDRQRAMAAIQAHLDGRVPYAIEYRVHRKDGAYRWWAARGSVTRTPAGHPVRWIGTVTDITDRKRVETELQRTKQELQQILNASAPLCVIDKDYYFLMVNDSFCSLVGISRDEAMGSKCHDILRVQPCGTDKCPFEKLLANPQRYKYETRLEDKQHREIFCAATATPYFNPNYSDVMGVVISFMDITERKKAERMTAETNEKLCEANKLLQEFTHVASHDLREPTRKIAAFGQMLAESLRDKLNDSDKENLHFMIDGADRMAQMIESLLEYSRVTTKSVAFEPVDLNEIIEQLKSVELALKVEEAGGIVLVPELLPSVEADPVQIRQLLQNLISNALKYHKKGVTPEVVIRAKGQEGGGVRLEVQDNGIGIKREQVGSLFVMFRRLHSRSEYEGTGIGLAVCKRIVERHGGQIGVESVYGQGSTFWFTLPAASTVKDQPELAFTSYGLAEHS